MSPDVRTAPSGPREPSAWRRFLARLREAEAAMSMTYDDVQDRRILALEREVSRLRGIVEAGRGGDASATNVD